MFLGTRRQALVDAEARQAELRSENANLSVMTGLWRMLEQTQTGRA